MGGWPTLQPRCNHRWRSTCKEVCVQTLPKRPYCAAQHKMCMSQHLVPLKHICGISYVWMLPIELIPSPRDGAGRHIRPASEGGNTQRSRALLTGEQAVEIFSRRFADSAGAATGAQSPRVLASQYGVRSTSVAHPSIHPSKLSQPESHPLYTLPPSIPNPLTPPRPTPRLPNLLFSPILSSHPLPAL
jgi:hypothetical protein